MSNTFISNARLKLAKNQAEAEQDPEADLLLLENYSHLHTCYHPKIIVHILKNEKKNKYIYINEIIRLILINMNIKMKNRSHRYEINRPRSRHGHYINTKSVSL